MSDLPHQSPERFVEVIVETLGPALLAFFRSKGVRDSNDLDDLLSEVWWLALRDAHHYTQDYGDRGYFWVLPKARTALGDWRRRNKHLAEIDADGGVAPDAPPLEQLTDSEAVQRLLRLFSKMARRDREVLCMRLNGLTLEDIGDRCGVGRSAVSERWQRIRDNLRRHLQQQERGMEEGQ